VVAEECVASLAAVLARPLRRVGASMAGTDLAGGCRKSLFEL
jgi:hypothetical protein